ncbi:cysteine proteinase [Mollisia scopiformis]|uniref:Ubiquitin carboxyl-terminal hydrolase n=1 Tax=Mollisia scopiformis TaxID=149040 RepID=A0A194WRG2_MOLSC|nr:cysteine proteinase [Mollisia scopiformis]KUJ10598.1 cysteine proteinase [Mollisia scopiformis]
MSESVSSMAGEDNAGPGGAGDDGRAWLEVESDPEEFQKILRKLGAKGVTVQELYGLEDEAIYELTGQVLGMIFLFNYRLVDGEESEDIQNCPSQVWFANQTTNNSCATVAMLNILLNVPGMRFDANGTDILGNLKASTANLIPAERGQVLSDNACIRQIHNSSAREIDALNASLQVQRDHDEWVKISKYRRKSNGTKRKRASSGKTKKPKQDLEDAYHYIAYVPIGRGVWRLDGLLKQPRNLGRFEGDWTALARQNVLARIAEEEDVEYNLMALCASEQQTVVLQSLKNAVSIEKIKQTTLVSSEQVAHHLKSAGIEPLQESELLSVFGITREQLNENQGLADDIVERMKAEDHLKLLRQLITEQNDLKTTFVERLKYDIQTSNGVEDTKEEDLTDATFNIIKALVDAGMIDAKVGRR